MSRITLVTACTLAMALVATDRAHAQTTPATDSIAAPAAKRLPREKLSGPRFGFTTFTGDVADLRDRAGLESIMTQFGWQWETKIVSTTGAIRP